VTITSHQPVDDRELERRLRTTFAAVMPLLDQPPATDDELVLVAVVDDVVAPDEGGNRPRRHRGAGLAATPIAAAIVLLFLAVRVRTVDPVSTTSSSTASALAAPRWYQVLRPFLPDGFDQMVLTNASAEAVSFRAWRTGTGQVLDVTIGLGTGGITETPDVATNTDEFGTWYASTSGVAPVTTDGTALLLVRQWRELHRHELEANWRRSRVPEPLEAIEPPG